MKTCLTILPLVALLSACDPVSERECGVFDHPDLAQWLAESDAEIIQYMSDDGTTLSFNRAAAVFSEPFRGSDTTKKSSDVVCDLTATVEMTATDASLSITTIYRQLEQLNVPSEEEQLVVDHRIEAPVGTRLAGGFYADLSDDRVRDNSINVVEIEATREIGGQLYNDVVSINAIDLGRVDQSSTVLSQIVMARTFGVVAFIDDEGTSFVRIPP